MGWDDISRWQAADLAAAFAMGDPIQTVDVRDIDYASETEQITGAIRIDPMEFERELAGLPDDRELIFYCGRPGEATSLKIAMWAFDSGRSRVGILVGGWDGWIAANGPREARAG